MRGWMCRLRHGGVRGGGGEEGQGAGDDEAKGLWCGLVFPYDGLSNALTFSC